LSFTSSLGLVGDGAEAALGTGAGRREATEDEADEDPQEAE